MKGCGPCRLRFVSDANLRKFSDVPNGRATFKKIRFFGNDYIGGSYRPKPQKPSEGLANPPGHLAVIIVSSKTSMKFGLSIA